jgi:hypothetical protein
MSASIRTCSPATHLAGKRPPSISGLTPSIRNPVRREVAQRIQFSWLTLRLARLKICETLETRFCSTGLCFPRPARSASLLAAGQGSNASEFSSTSPSDLSRSGDVETSPFCAEGNLLYWTIRKSVLDVSPAFSASRARARRPSKQLSSSNLFFTSSSAFFVQPGRLRDQPRFCFQLRRKVCGNPVIDRIAQSRRSLIHIAALPSQPRNLHSPIALRAVTSRQASPVVTESRKNENCSGRAPRRFGPAAPLREKEREIHWTSVTKTAT